MAASGGPVTRTATLTDRAVFARTYLRRRTPVNACRPFCLTPSTRNIRMCSLGHELVDDTLQPNSQSKWFELVILGYVMYQP